MTQPDLFGDAGGPPRWRADPDKVRRRLERILSEARAAAGNPWSSSQTQLYKTIVPNMTRWLPEDEAARWRAAFDAEMARFEKTKAA